MEEFSRIQRLPAYVFNITGEMKTAARRRGEDIIDFGMGNPDGATPKHIVDKLIEAVLKPPTHRYSVSRGLPRLRKAICNWYQTRYGVDLDPESEAIVTIGSKEGIAHLCLAILDSRDTVLVPNPSYPIHIYGPVIAGAHIVSVPVHDQEQFLQQLEDLIPRMTPRPKALIVNFPPTPPPSASSFRSSRALSSSPASTASISFRISHTPTSPSTATSRPASCRSPAPKRSQSSSSRFRSRITCPVGASASW